MLHFLVTFCFSFGRFNKSISFMCRFLISISFFVPCVYKWLSCADPCWGFVFVCVSFLLWRFIHFLADYWLYYNHFAFDTMASIFFCRLFSVLRLLCFMSISISRWYAVFICSNTHTQRDTNTKQMCTTKRISAPSSLFGLRFFRWFNGQVTYFPKRNKKKHKTITTNTHKSSEQKRSRNYFISTLIRFFD